VGELVGELLDRSEEVFGRFCRSVAHLLQGEIVNDGFGRHVGIEEATLARPMQAAWISAASFASFALIPIVALLAVPSEWDIPAIAACSLASLAALGALGGHLGGAPVGRAALRVTVGGGLAMVVTAVIGRLFGVATG